MTQSGRDLLAELKKKAADGAECMEEEIDQAIKAIFSYIILEQLHLGDSFRKIEKGTICSLFSIEEAGCVSQADGEIGGLMVILWSEDNAYCMKLDFLEEDFENDRKAGFTRCATLEDYREMVEQSYEERRLDILERAINHAEEKYGEIVISGRNADEEEKSSHEAK